MSIAVIAMNDTTMMIKLTIPIKALSVNRAFAGRRFKSTYYKNFEREVALLLPFAKNMIKGECDVHYTFYVKNYAKSDVDNMIKPIQDLIIAREYLSDDRKIVYLTARKIKSNVDKISIEIKEL